MTKSGGRQYRIPEQMRPAAGLSTHHEPENQNTYQFFSRHFLQQYSRMKKRARDKAADFREI